MKIFKGDDTGGRLGKALTITVHTKYDLTDCLVFFNYQGITRKWEGVKDGDTLDLFFSHNETARMSVGTFKGTMFAVDPAGKYRTIDNAIPITVTTSLRDCYGDDHFDVVVGVAINWDDIVHKPFEGQEIDIGTDDKVLAALGTIIEKLGGTVKVGIALVALCAISSFGYTTDTHNNTFVRDGVTYVQRGGLGTSDHVVTNVDVDAQYESEKFASAVARVSPPVELPEKWALANVTNASGNAVTAGDVDAYTKSEADAELANKRDKTDLDIKLPSIESCTWGTPDTELRDALIGVVPVFSNGKWSAVAGQWTSNLVPGTGYEENVSFLFTDGIRENAPANANMVRGEPETVDTLATTNGVNEAIEAHHDDTKRDLADNTCHKTEFTEWVFSDGVARTLYHNQNPQSNLWYWNNFSQTWDGTDAPPDGSLVAITEFESATFLEFNGGSIGLTATRSKVCTDGKKFVTSDVVDGKVSSAVSTNNPAFVSAVQNTPTENIPEDMPTDWGTYGTVGAALAALAAFVKWAKAKIVAIIGDDGKPTDQFTTNLLGKPAANIKANSSAFAPEYSATSAYSVGSIVWHDGNIYQCKTAIAEGGEAWNAEHWELRKLDDFFTESNSLLNGRLAYSRNATGLKDRAFNTLSFDGTEFNLSTALEEVTPTASGQPRDLLIVATATAATTIGYTAGTIKGDKPTIDGSGTWLITLTEYASGVWYCRQIKMEDAA